MSPEVFPGCSDPRNPTKNQVINRLEVNRLSHTEFKYKYFLPSTLKFVYTPSSKVPKFGENAATSASRFVQCFLSTLQHGISEDQVLIVVTHRLGIAAFVEIFDFNRSQTKAGFSSFAYAFLNPEPTPRRLSLPPIGEKKEESKEQPLLRKIASSQETIAKHSSMLRNKEVRNFGDNHRVVPHPPSNLPKSSEFQRKNVITKKKPNLRERYHSEGSETNRLQQKLAKSLVQLPYLKEIIDHRSRSQGPAISQSQQKGIELPQIKRKSKKNPFHSGIVNPYEIMCDIKNSPAQAGKLYSPNKKKLMNLNHRRPVRVINSKQQSGSQAASPPSPTPPPPASTYVKAEENKELTLADQFAPKWSIGELCFTGEGQI